MSDESTAGTAAPAETVKPAAKKKSGGSAKRKSGGERKPRVDLIGQEFGERGRVAARAYFSAHKDERKTLLAALRAKSKAADPEKVKKITDSIAKLQARLNAATNSEAIIAGFKAKLVSVANTIYGEEQPKEA
jgi:hypothetical protein